MAEETRFLFQPAVCSPYHCPLCARGVQVFRVPASADAAIPSPAIEAAREDESRDERQREIEQMVEDQPEEMAALLRGWLGAGR